MLFSTALIALFSTAALASPTPADKVPNQARQYESCTASAVVAYGGGSTYSGNLQVTDSSGDTIYSGYGGLSGGTYSVNFEGPSGEIFWMSDYDRDSHFFSSCETNQPASSGAWDGEIHGDDGPDSGPLSYCVVTMSVC